MTQLFIQLVQSVTGAVVTIVALLLVAAIIGYLTAWFYSKSVYTPKIKALEADKATLGTQVDGLNSDIRKLNDKAEKLNVKIAKLEEDNATLNTQVDGLNNDIGKLNNKTGKLNVKIAKLDDELAEKNIGKFVINVAKDGQHYFNLKDVNSQTILKSEMYTTRASCNNGIESVRKNCEDEKRYEYNESSDNRFYFNLKAVNGQIIGTSQMYDSKEEMDSAIQSVIMNGKSTAVEEGLT
jgi:uncharacterized protein YegP (UPF0339 family)/outer membrane murein-binding lipoprotein Lpp